MTIWLRTAAGVAVFAGVCLGCGGGGGGGGGGGTPTAPTPGTGIGATITIRADGSVDPKDVRIDVGQMVRFVNQDTRAHEMLSNPHTVHTECPATNDVGVVNVGQSKTTAVFSRVSSCGFHDHMNAEATRMQGSIRVGTDDSPTGPVYVIH